jgi:NAD(P)-dependent dehydrogenase (short-subunit alcohol dehydrogenase family)
MNLEDKAGIVTGAGRGIGRSVALLMARERASVIVNDPGAGRNGEVTTERPADEVVAEIAKAAARRSRTMTRSLTTPVPAAWCASARTRRGQISYAAKSRSIAAAIRNNLRSWPLRATSISPTGSPPTRGSGIEIAQRSKKLTSAGLRRIS